MLEKIKCIAKGAAKALVIAPVAFGGWRGALNYASKNVKIDPNVKNIVTYAGTVLTTVVVATAVSGKKCSCSCKKEEKTEEVAE